MHQTTVRFGRDLWEALEAETARLGVSAAQYLREAALARLSYTAALRGEREYEAALVGVGARLDAEAPSTDVRRAHAAQHESSEQVLVATAVTAQSELVWKRAREVREHAAELRRRRREMGL